MFASVLGAVASLCIPSQSKSTLSKTPDSQRTVVSTSVEFPSDKSFKSCVTSTTEDDVIKLRESKMFLEPHLGNEKRHRAGSDFDRRPPLFFTNDFVPNLGPTKRNTSDLCDVFVIPVQLTPDQEQSEMISNIASRVQQMLQADLTGEFDRTKDFMGQHIPAISFLKYVERLILNINKWAHEKPGVDSTGVRSGIMAIEYLERVQAKITPRSIHRYFLIAFLMGIKFSYDFYMSNTFWAAVGGLKLHEMNLMEIEFCNRLNWDSRISPESFQAQFDKTRCFI